MTALLKIEKGWTLKHEGKVISATVPGDVTLDLWNGGIVKDPYYGLNHLELGWIINTDFEYSCRFSVPSEIMEREEVLLEFDGIDTFSEISLNGKELGKTENMFLKYSYSVKELLKPEDNLLTVKLIGTGKVMEGIDDKGFFGTFNVKRLFIRKAQCHFGWDWAPDMPGYGIHGDVKLIGVPKTRITDITYRAYNDGNLTVMAELNYTTRPHVDFNGKIVKECDSECKNDILRFTVATRPNEALAEGNTEALEVKVDGRKNFVNFEISKPELWWPCGYGSQPLYSYKVELVRGDRIVDTAEGKFAFREVELSEKPVDGHNMGYKFLINGKEVFIKGSNWVPAECFIGAIKDEKYERLIKQAADAHMNMLRVWGGGIYEKDIFYDICDREGMLVWQDLMFACGDIPEDDLAFVENCKAEINYQIKRLRNHPSLIYWCGGNEKTGSYGLQVSHGDYFIDVVLRGLVGNLDNTRPYARQSPCSLTDIGNDKTSGESHAGSFEACLELGVLNYRDAVSKTSVPFISECAIMGPTSLEGFRKMFPEDKLWPMNEYWDDRLMDNPYAAVLMTFAKRQAHYAEALYGECRTIEDFIAKGMTVHAETIRAEAEYARFHKKRTGGFMNWMYTDIWPSATWSVVDYFCEPKQVYYQMKKSYAPVLLTYTQSEGGVTNLALINDTLYPVSKTVEYGLKTLSGEVVWKNSAVLFAEAGGVASLELTSPVDGKNTYLYAMSGDGELRTVYSPDMWHSCKFESDYRYTVKSGDGCVEVTLKANAFAKGVTLRLPDNCRYTYSDNYFDLEAGEEKTVCIYGATGDEAVTVTDFAKETKV